MKKVVDNLRFFVFNSEEFSDCIFLVEGKKIYAHKGRGGFVIFSDFGCAIGAVSGAVHQRDEGVGAVDY